MFENCVTFGHHASLWQHGHPMALRMVACSNAFTCSMVAQACSNTLKSTNKVYKSNETNENFIFFLARAPWGRHHYQIATMVVGCKQPAVSLNVLIKTQVGTTTNVGTSLEGQLSLKCSEHIPPLGAHAAPQSRNPPPPRGGVVPLLAEM